VVVDTVLLFPRLHAYLRHRIGDSAAAEELASEVFVEAVARIDRYEWRGLPFAAWLFRIARNLAVSHIRRRARHEKALRRWDVPQPQRSHLERQDDTRDLTSALDSLTEEQRDVIVLRFVDDFSVRETAQILKKSEGAVKTMQHRALASLRRTMITIDTSWEAGHAS
jgi:RNA polymerase sigma-70 factor (ECF subfamily)